MLGLPVIMGSTFYSKRYAPDSARHRKVRQKTFKTKEQAENWAKKQGLKSYQITPVQFSSKLRVSY